MSLLSVSFPRTRESRGKGRRSRQVWIPAFAGMTRGGLDDSISKQNALASAELVQQRFNGFDESAAVVDLAARPFAFELGELDPDNLVLR